MRKLKERYAARDFRELRSSLSSWSFPIMYPEYQGFSIQAAELEEDFERTENTLKKCSAPGDFRELRRLLESWDFPRTYLEYQRFSNEALLAAELAAKLCIAGDAQLVTQQLAGRKRLHLKFSTTSSSSPIVKYRNVMMKKCRDHGERPQAERSC